MFRTLLGGKIHRATVTQADLNYVGSITIDQDLLDAAGILVNEKVQIVNNNNGERFETYTISGERGSGVICLNGAAARLVQAGDIVIIMSYVMLSEPEIAAHQPKVVLVDERNHIRDIIHYEPAHTILWLNARRRVEYRFYTPFLFFRLPERNKYG